MERLLEKIAIVTGGGQGIGAAIAKTIAEEGAKVAVVGRTLSKCEKVVADIEGKDGRLIPLQCDITSVTDIEKVIKTCCKEFGHPNVLVNNAGVNSFSDPLKLDDDEWWKCLDIDLKGAWNFTRAVLPGMIEQGGGAVINISSVHGHKIIPHCFPYPVAKHGLRGLTKALGIEYAPYNIRVNSISPGLIETPLSVEWYKSMVAAGAAPDIDSFRKMQAELLPCKRIGTPEEVAMTTVFLASDEARFINAADILIDGGRTALYHD